MDSKTFREALKLDVRDLHTACLELASLYEEKGTQWAEAVKRRDELKDKLSVKKAEIDERIRKAPREYGWERDIDKVTETWISTRVLNHPEVVQLNHEIIEANFDVNVLAIGKEAIDHRDNALRYLVDLYKGSYFKASGRSFIPERSEAASISQDEQAAAMDTDPRMVALGEKRRLIKKNE